MQLQLKTVLNHVHPLKGFVYASVELVHLPGRTAHIEATVKERRRSQPTCSNCGKVAEVVAIPDAIAKKRSGRRIPMHPDLRRTLKRLLRESEVPGLIIRSARGGGLRATSVVNWFAALFANLGFEGCSSHSGRRTFITRAARNIHRTGCSLRDVQLLAGHRSIETTERYIDGDTRGQRRLVGLL